MIIHLPHQELPPHYLARQNTEKEFSTIAKQISKWLAAKNQEAA